MVYFYEIGVVWLVWEIFEDSFIVMGLVYVVMMLLVESIVVVVLVLVEGK